MNLTPRDRAAVQNRQNTVKVDLRALRQFLARARRELRLANADLTVRLVSDAEIRRLNRVYRKRNQPTDVLSFPAERRRTRGRSSRRLPAEGKREPLGDIAISPATARRYARKHGRSFIGEMRILILHGVLHLLGYDHEADDGEMDRVETRFRQRLGLQ
ncbi:MAG TPA: rRNA maturation RNase YbeY [Candidatus Saccharimonadales bacterium]|jgi:probable rRNA maturation factor|nr:rRNA maturation RNase YbeY [Candidatus Saccharimonadales bacterium]